MIASQTHILLRGDGYFSNPELMQLILDDGNADFIFGLTGNAVLSRRAEGWMKNARGHLALHQSMHVQKYGPVVQSMRLFGEFEYAAKSWSQARRAWYSRPKCWQAATARPIRTTNVSW